MKLLLYLLLLLPFVDCFSRYDEFSDESNKVIYYISQFKYDHVGDMIQISKVDTNSAEGNYLVSYFYVAHNDVKSAEKYLFKATNIKDHPGFANFLKGRIEYSKENYDLAYEYFTKSLNWQPDFELAVIGVVTSLLSNEDVKGAETAIEKYIKDHPNSGEAIYFKGLILLKKGKFEKALEYFNQILGMQTFINRSDAYASRGNAELDNNLLDAAERSFDTALYINNTSAIAWHGKGLATYRQENYKDAVEAFKNELRILYTNTSKSSYLKEAYYNLGMSYIRLGDAPNACVNFHEGCKLGNDNACYMVVTKCSKSSGTTD